MKVLSKDKLETVFNRLAQESDVYVPMQRGEQSGFFSFLTYDAARDEIALDILNTYLPPKNIILPQTEKMYSFRQEGTKVNIEEVYEDSQPKIIFGIRGCDAKAVECLDMVFLTRGYEDSFYKSRRENTVIIANACYAPGPNCFCESMGIDPVNPRPADVIIRDTGNGTLVWEAASDKGKKISDQISEFLEEKDVKLPEAKQCQRQVAYDGVAEKLRDMFASPVWDKLSEPCQNCGICTYLCPTCYCFDIQVKSWGEEGYRFRCWDSCMYREYTQMAGGHNPRETGTERFRNRFLHKLEFFKERYGTSLCTGCGRCIIACPVGIDITNIVDLIKEVDAGA
ncbi:MAG: 4Fe-4S dicluster domain-containing protein [Syntrophomonadaceae bacterium]|nr:4Fe-4S dicluster domain-containing protein [Syntrophomonadaceae bacterium]